MSRIREAFRARCIVNIHDLLTKYSDAGMSMAYGVAYSVGQSRGLGPHSSFFHVKRSVNPNGAWYERGSKWFMGRSDSSLLKALQHAADHTGIKEWSLCPLSSGQYLPTSVLRAAMKDVGVRFNERKHGPVDLPTGRRPD